MMVQGQVKLTKKGISLVGAETTLEQLRNKFLKKKESTLLKVKFEDEEPYKTYPQLGYLFNELGVKAAIGYKGLGYNIETREKAVAKLCMDLDFVERIMDNDGNPVCAYPISISKAKKSILADLIRHASIYIRVDMGLDVMTPDEFLKGKKI